MSHSHTSFFANIIQPLYLNPALILKMANFEYHPFRNHFLPQWGITCYILGHRYDVFTDNFRWGLDISNLPVSSHSGWARKGRNRAHQQSFGGFFCASLVVSILCYIKTTPVDGWSHWCGGPFDFLLEVILELDRKGEAKTPATLGILWNNFISRPTHSAWVFPSSDLWPCLCTRGVGEAVPETFGSQQTEKQRFDL